MGLWATVAPGYATIEAFVAGFTPDSFNDPAQAAAYVAWFKLDTFCRDLEADRLQALDSALDRAVSSAATKPFEPDYADLARLHHLVLSRRVVSSLEFSSGFSTAILAHAHQILNGHFADWAKANTRVDQPFHVHAVEEAPYYLDITRARLGQGLAPFASVTRSSVEMILHDNRIATVYSRLPNICPDFIYLDGPSQYATDAEVNGISLTTRTRMPMSADILRIEFLLEPGTLILVDGRTANARFLKAYLKRNWFYRHDTEGDVHYFELVEDPLGPINKRRLDFCLDGKWLLA
jgi:hypothetical protein